MKAATATKLVLNTLTTGVMVRLGRVWGNLMVDLQVTCEKLQDRGERIVMEVLGVDRERARSLLDEAGGSVKTALVMARLGVDPAEAARRLDAVDGRLGALLGDAP
jgi:N-acetylmuramic acid 6-phosphate etherase